MEVLGEENHILFRIVWVEVWVWHGWEDIFLLQTKEVVWVQSPLYMCSTDKERGETVLQDDNPFNNIMVSKY